MWEHAHCSIAEWVVLAQDGDTRAFEELVCACDGHACQVAYAMLDDVGGADEAIQAARIAAWKTLDTYDSDLSNFEDWYLGIVRNRCRRVNKKRQRARACVSLDDLEHVLITPLDQIIYAEETLARERQKGFVLGALAALPPRQADMIRAYFFEGKLQREIAKQYGCDRSTVSGNIAAGLRTLRKRLKDGFPQEWDRRRRGGAAPYTPSINLGG